MYWLSDGAFLADEKTGDVCPVVVQHDPPRGGAHTYAERRSQREPQSLGEARPAEGAPVGASALGATLRELERTLFF